MSSNIHQIFLANPTTTFVANDLMYLGRSPYAATDDFAFTYSSLIPVNTKGDLFTWSTAATRLGVGANGTLLTPDSTAATGLKWTTATYPATTTINQVLYSSANNVVSGIATSNAAIFVTDSGGVPLTSYQIPIGVMQNITTVGTVAAGTWQGDAIGPTFGGTGLTSYITGDTIYANGTNSLTKLAGNTTTAKMFMSQTGDGINSAAPIWETIDGGDITGAALTKVDDTNVTLTLGGTPTTALLQATSITAGWTGTLGVTRGGTGTGTTFTQGSIVFAGASGVYSQDNSNLFWDDASDLLGVGTSSSLTTTVNVNGVISLFDSGIRTFNAGIATEVTGQLIEIGINDSNSNRFGGVYTSANQGGFLRVDARAGNNLFSFFSRVAGSTSSVTSTAFLTSAGNFGLSAGSVTTTATDGFPYIPTCAGTPTGVPTTLTGLAPVVWDSTNDQLYIYDSGWKKSITSGEALTKVDDTNVTLTLGGSPSTALVNAASITAGWSGQLSMARGGTGANLTPSDGGVVVSNASTLAILASPADLNKILLSDITGGPHWSLSSFPDSCVAGNLLVCNATNVWSLLTPVNDAVLTSGATGLAVWSTTLAVTKGGTGTSTQFTQGSVVFAGASGIYSQDNANFFWNDSTNRLSLGTTNSTTTLNVNGVISLLDGGTRTLNCGITTEADAQLIEIGLNDSSSNRFGGSYTSANQGGFLRIEGRTGSLFSFSGRAAGDTSAVQDLLTLNTSSVLTLNGYSGAASSFVLTGGVSSGAGSNIKVYGAGGVGSTVFMDLSTYDPTSNAPSSRLVSIDVGSFTSDINLQTKIPGAAGNALKTRLIVSGNGNVVVGDNANVPATNATDGFIYIPYCAGTPTGVPGSYTGSLAMIYDNVNDKLYVYNGAWKGVTLT